MNGRSFLRSIKQQRGVTLAELMIALVLSMLLMTGVISVFMANKRTYQVQEALARLQENGRFATQLMIRDIRGAGYWGCGSQKPAITNTVNITGTPYVYEYGKSVDGFESVTPSSWSPTLDGSIVSPLGGSDVLTVRFSEGTGARVIQHNTPSANIKLVAHAGIKIGDIVMVSDCSNAAIMQITNLTLSPDKLTNVVHNTGVGVPGNSEQNLGKKYTNGDLVVMRTRSYYVRNGVSGGPALWRVDNNTPQELIEGVEQLQVLYGVDTNSDKSADQYDTANTVEAGGNWDKVVSVRLNLLLQSIRDNVTDAPQTYTFNGATVTPADNRLRHIFTATVALRNRAG